MLATVGALRVVSESDLHDARDESQDTRRTVRYLEKEGLARTSPISSDDRALYLALAGSLDASVVTCDRPFGAATGHSARIEVIRRAPVRE